MAAEQAPAMLDVLVLQGLLVEAGDSYTGTASFKDSVFSVNGQPIPLGDSL